MVTHSESIASIATACAAYGWGRWAALWYGVGIAPDGWRMTWNLARTPARVDYVEPCGQVYSTLSGQITEADLARLVKRFRGEHSGQGVLW